MRHLLTLSFLLTLIVPDHLQAAPGDIITEKALTGIKNPTGIAWNGKTIWVADRKTDSFNEIDPETGILIRSIDSPGYFPSGLALHDDLLWSVDPSAAKIYATDPVTGNTVKTIDSPTPSPTGLAWNGSELWICDNSSDIIMKIDPEDGTTIISFPAPATDPRGMTFGNGYLWCSDRIRDRIFMIDIISGEVVIILDSPGPFTWGLAWKDGHLLNTDYQNDKVYELVTSDGDAFSTFDPRKAKVDFTTEAVAMGPGMIVSLDVYLADPSDRPGQKILEPVKYSIEPDFHTDRWGQRIAAFHFDRIESGNSVEVSMNATVEASAIRYFIYPEKVSGKIPDEIRKKYLADDIKYDINNPYIRKIIEETVGDEQNLYWKARKLFQYLIANMEYKLAGGWNTAPTVLKRKNGSCSEYSFSFIALCRAAGVPARYVGSLVVRGDDASYDDVFHRWNEIYLPGYGWVPVDANAGDKELPADQAAAFGGIANRFLITTEGGGGSEYLGWSYNHENRWISKGKCTVKAEVIAEWSPIE
ncbi:MAG: transglutaminase [Candidatus Krumholzibacteriota bacterium]|nr:transglutaminase [Candidatus Krumholzibacteriota bacterium]